MPGIFISYRRSDSAGQAGRLFDRLAAHFGDDRVFMDVDTLAPSDHFASRIEKAIATADVMLVLIGPRWAAEAHRLADPEDFVRRELMAGLRVGCKLVPVSIDGVPFPDPSTLPQEIRAVVESEGATLRHAEFGRDADHLVEVLARLVQPAPEATRRCVAAALVRAGWPFSWMGPVARRVPLRAALGAVLVALAVAWSATVWLAQWQARLAGYADGSREATETALTASVNAVADRALVLRGRVKDAANADVGGATVTLRNEETGATTTATTGSEGGFRIDLRRIDVQRNTTIELVVEKLRYRPQRESFSYIEGFDYRSVLHPEPEASRGR